jgi:signal transduction histidine kinase/DNA-binding response OmpR family regulator
MATPLRTLFVEDSEEDVRLVLRVLRREGYEPAYERVETEEAMRSALRRRQWDVILADFAMPNFTAPAALNTLKESGLDIPFIIVSGTIGEETAVAAMRSGAHDYLLKDNLLRLPSAIGREIRDASAREARRRSEADLIVVNRALRLLSSVNQALIREDSEIALLQRVCDIAVEEGGYGAAWVGVAEDEGHLVRPVCASGLGRTYLLSRRVSWAEADPDCDFTGSAICTGTCSIVQDLASVPSDVPWLREALDHGYRSLIALPASVNGRMRVALTLLGAVKVAFPSEEVKLLQEMAGDLSFGIAVNRVRQERERAIESLRNSTDQLRRINADLDQFAYVAAHDLQEPLRTISGYLELLCLRFANGLAPQAREFVQLAIDSAQRMHGLILALLEYSHIGSQMVIPQVVDMEKVLEETLVSHKPRMEETRAVVTHDPVPTIRGDKSLLLKLFINLIDNALKFRKENEAPRIHIGVTRQDAEWVFSVSDNGIGIASCYFERIFIMFHRLHRPGLYPGTGIGLAICKRIVEKHGGRIWVESHKGEGSHFRFTLPAERVERHNE